MLAAEVGTGEAEILAQEVRERQTRLDFAFELGAVHLQAQNGHHAALTAASANARSVSTRTSRRR